MRSKELGLVLEVAVLRLTAQLTSDCCCHSKPPVKYITFKTSTNFIMCYYISLVFSMSFRMYLSVRVRVCVCLCISVCLSVSIHVRTFLAYTTIMQRRHSSLKTGGLRVRV